MTLWCFGTPVSAGWNGKPEDHWLWTEAGGKGRVHRTTICTEHHIRPGNYSNLWLCNSSSKHHRFTACWSQPITAIILTTMRMRDMNILFWGYTEVLKLAWWILFYRSNPAENESNSNDPLNYAGCCLNCPVSAECQHHLRWFPASPRREQPQYLDWAFPHPQTGTELTRLPSTLLIFSRERDSQSRKASGIWNSGNPGRGTSGNCRGAIYHLPMRIWD